MPSAICHDLFPGPVVRTPSLTFEAWGTPTSSFVENREHFAAHVKCCAYCGRFFLDGGIGPAFPSLVLVDIDNLGPLVYTAWLSFAWPTSWGGCYHVVLFEIQGGFRLLGVI